MTDLADANLVLAAINPADALHERARSHLEKVGRLAIPISVGIELLLVAKKHGVGFVELLAAAEERFELEQADVLYTAAEALDSGDLKTVFDATHLATGLHRAVRLHTADKELLRSPFATVPY